MRLILSVDWFNKYAIYFSNPRSWIMWAIISLHDYMMFFLINILIVVLVFIFISLRMQEHFIDKLFLKKYIYMRIDEFNDAPLLEFIWTLIPAGILFAMAWPSFKLLFAIEQLIDPFHTVVIIGNQWYWTYQYSDFDVVSDMIIQLDSKEGKNYIISVLKNQQTKELLKNKKIFNILEYKKFFSFHDLLEFSSSHLRKYEEAKLIYDSVIIPDENLPVGYPRLLSTDQVLILPSNTSIRLLITSADVIHSWALPSHGIKMDAIPGRINQVGFLTPFWGTYWGQCSELCGINHGFMPIEVRVLNIEDYITFIKLNISYRYDKLIPVLENCFRSFFNYYADQAVLDKIFINFFDNTNNVYFIYNNYYDLIIYKNFLVNFSTIFNDLDNSNETTTDLPETTPDLSETTPDLSESEKEEVEPVPSDPFVPCSPITPQENLIIETRKLLAGFYGDPSKSNTHGIIPENLIVRSIFGVLKIEWFNHGIIKYSYYDKDANLMFSKFYIIDFSLFLEFILSAGRSLKENDGKSFKFPQHWQYMWQTREARLRSTFVKLMKTWIEFCDQMIKDGKIKKFAVKDPHLDYLMEYIQKRAEKEIQRRRMEFFKRLFVIAQKYGHIKNTELLNDRVLILNKANLNKFNPDTNNEKS